MLDFELLVLGVKLAFFNQLYVKLVVAETHQEVRLHHDHQQNLFCLRCKRVVVEEVLQKHEHRRERRPELIDDKSPRFLLLGLILVVLALHQAGDLERLNVVGHIVEVDGNRVSLVELFNRLDPNLNVLRSLRLIVSRQTKLSLLQNFVDVTFLVRLIFLRVNDVFKADGTRLIRLLLACIEFVISGLFANLAPLCAVLRQFDWREHFECHQLGHLKYGLGRLVLVNIF